MALDAAFDATTSAGGRWFRDQNGNRVGLLLGQPQACRRSPPGRKNLVTLRHDLGHHRIGRVLCLGSEVQPCAGVTTAVPSSGTGSAKYHVPSSMSMCRPYPARPFPAAAQHQGDRRSRHHEKRNLLCHRCPPRTEITDQAMPAQAVCSQHGAGAHVECVELPLPRPVVAAREGHAGSEVLPLTAIEHLAGQALDAGSDDVLDDGRAARSSCRCAP